MDFVTSSVANVNVLLASQGTIALHGTALKSVIREASVFVVNASVSNHSQERHANSQNVLYHVVLMVRATPQLESVSVSECMQEHNATFSLVRKTATAMGCVLIKESVDAILAGSARIVRSTNAIRNASMVLVIEVRGNASVILDTSQKIVARKNAVVRVCHVTIKSVSVVGPMHNLHATTMRESVSATRVYRLPNTFSHHSVPRENAQVRVTRKHRSALALVMASVIMILGCAAAI